MQVFLHTDAAQAVGKIPLDVNASNIDLMSISGHKLYGPKGIGAIYVRRRPRVRLEPQMNGGGQERGLRSGTVPTPLVVGLGAACDLAHQVRTLPPGGSPLLLCVTLEKEVRGKPPKAQSRIELKIFTLTQMAKQHHGTPAPLLLPFQEMPSSLLPCCVPFLHLSQPER